MGTTSLLRPSTISRPHFRAPTITCQLMLAHSPLFFSSVMHLLPDRFPHHIGQRLPLGKLAQRLVHQSLVIAARHFGARLKHRQRSVIHPHRDAGFSAVRGLQLRQCRHFDHGLGLSEIHLGVALEHRVRTVAHNVSFAEGSPSRLKSSADSPRAVSILRSKFGLCRPCPASQIAARPWYPRLLASEHMDQATPGEPRQTSRPHDSTDWRRLFRVEFNLHAFDCMHKWMYRKALRPNTSKISCLNTTELTTQADGLLF